MREEVASSHQSSVINNQTPEYPADFTGGFVLVNTKQLPEEDGLSVSIGAGMNDKTHGKRFLSAQGSSWDWLGLGSGWRSLDAGMKGGLIICGKVQYCLSIRDPRIADTSQSNGFESDNNASGAETAPFTTATFRNVTFIGPVPPRTRILSTPPTTSLPEASSPTTVPSWVGSSRPYRYVAAASSM